jgi:CRISPR/Cas system CSM-associated protein Csm3 (group 7 of RAMP superfamily)
MARKVHTRLRIEGALEAETPLHVGGFGESPDTDLPLAQNGRGEWYVPGTSLAGVLRSWCFKHFGQANEALFKEIFGFQEADKGHASFVLIEDATIEDAGEILTEIRDGVGIDRYYGVAADKVKFDRAILPRGTKLKFNMTVEIGSKKEADKNGQTEADKKAESQEGFEIREKQTKAVIGHMLAALMQSEIRFGAARTRGLGRVILIGKKREGDGYESEPEIREQSLIGHENILKLLNGGAEPRKIADLTKDAGGLTANPAPRLDIQSRWRPRLPVMVKAGYDGIGVDMLPLTSGVDKDSLALCMPGSSIKGVLRSHAERIIRTLLHDCARTKDQPFNEQIDALPLIEELFGTRGKSKAESKSPDESRKCKSSSSPRLGLGALAIDDCYAKELHSEAGKEESFWINADDWHRVEIARAAKPEAGAKAPKEVSTRQSQDKGEPGEVSYFDRELWKYLREIDELQRGLSKEKYKEDTSRFKIHHHVAIDRWTGGASEGALYSVLAPAKIEWEEMRLTLDFGRIEKDSQLPALMLLLLTLRDVAENRLPFGFATNRGMGEIEVEEILFSGSGLAEIGFAKSKGNFAELKDELKSKFSSEDWKAWLDNLNK